MLGDATDFVPIPGAAEEGPGRFRVRSSRVPSWSPKGIGLLFLGLAALPSLPIPGPPGDATPARRVRGVRDGAILTFAFAPDGETIASISTGGRVALRHAAAGAGAHSFLEHSGPARALAFSPDGRSLAVGVLESDIFLYGIRDGGAGHPLGMPVLMPASLAFSPDGRLLAASSYLDAEILLWDFAAGRERARLRGHGSP